jgi:hypothetical protein
MHLEITDKKEGSVETLPSINFRLKTLQFEVGL